ncbi:hypothetical protein [Pseudomonas sp. PS02290]|uniref:hypothetical protein n=1 Tax=Pseudomonas sp. PS02290 TaxID=2991430 RepID=UPI00249A21B1|nr:hypothetical protein [Pseudomonas sp. PS02290]
MYEFIIHDDATGDLREILAADRAAGVKLAAFLAQLRVDQDLLDRLSQSDYGGSPARPRPRSATFNVGMWVAAQQKGMNLWRLRCFTDEIVGYRLIYAFLPATDQYVLLAIAEKAEVHDKDDERFDYELKHEIASRVINSYRDLVD